MKVTNGELHNIRESLKVLISVPMPIKTGFQLAKLAAELDEPTKVMQTCREQLFKTYGEVDPKNPIIVRMPPDSPNFPKFAEELGVLMSLEVEIPCEVVILPGTLEIAPSVLISLEKFVSLETN